MEIKKQLNSKTKNALTIICGMLLTITLAILSGMLFTNVALAQAQKKAVDRDLSYVSQAYPGIDIKVKKDFTSRQVVDKFISDDTTYKGVISQDAVVKSSINIGKKKPFETYSLVYDDRLLFDNVLVNEDVDIPDGYYGLYVAGYEWNKIKTGEKLSVTLPKTTGGTKTLNVIIAGKFNYGVLLSSIQGEPVYNSFRSIVAIKGFDLKQINPNADDYLTVYTNKKLNDILEDDYGVTAGSSMSNDLFFTLNEKDDLSSKLLYKPYIAFIIYLVIMAAIFFIGSKYRTINYILYATVIFIVMLVYYFVKVLKTIGIYPYQQFLTNWFIGILFGVIILTLFAAVIISVIIVQKYKKYNKDA